MSKEKLNFGSAQSGGKAFSWGDGFAVLFVIALLYLGARLAFNAPAEITGPDISLDPKALPWYTLLSVARMLAAYILSLLFTLVYGRWAAYNKRAEKILMPLLDVLQSVPILSFLPIVLLGLSAVLPEKMAAEIASIVLIFTSQVWNLTFAWYQSLTTIPKEYKEASNIFRLNRWMRFKNLELPFGMISLVWNSMMSWAGGWFFLMAAEIFTVGKRDFRLPGLGAYLHEAANMNNISAILWGIFALVATVVVLDQLVWNPLLAWADKFKVEMVENENPPKSWFYDLISKGKIRNWLYSKVFNPLSNKLDAFMIRRYPMKSAPAKPKAWQRGLRYVVLVVVLGGLGFLIAQAVLMMVKIPGLTWGDMGLGLLATLGRVLLSLILALAWTVPLGVYIGTNPKVSAVLQPIVQVMASVPATALFPVVLLVMIKWPSGLEMAAILLMLMGTQWYLLFNIIAGASAIPQDLKHTAELMGLSKWERWKTLILPAIFPYLITGAITASGGAWNASIVAEYQIFDGSVLKLKGIGSIISHATAEGDYPLLLASTLAMILAVVLINRLLWRKLYSLAEEKYRMEN